MNLDYENSESFLGPPTGMAGEASSDSKSAWDPFVLVRFFCHHTHNKIILCEALLYYYHMLKLCKLATVELHTIIAETFPTLGVCLDEGDKGNGREKNDTLVWESL